MPKISVAKRLENIGRYALIDQYNSLIRRIGKDRIDTINKAGKTSKITKNAGKEVSDDSLRRYVNTLREAYNSGELRHTAVRSFLEDFIKLSVGSDGNINDEVKEEPSSDNEDELRDEEKKALDEKARKAVDDMREAELEQTTERTEVRLKEKEERSSLIAVKNLKDTKNPKEKLERARAIMKSATARQNAPKSIIREAEQITEEMKNNPQNRQTTQQPIVKKEEVSQPLNEKKVSRVRIFEEEKKKRIRQSSVPVKRMSASEMVKAYMSNYKFIM